MKDGQKSTEVWTIVLLFDSAPTWTSIVRHMAEGDFIDSSDTVTERKKRWKSKMTLEEVITLCGPQPMWGSGFVFP